MAVGGIATFAAFVIFNFLVHGLYLTDDPWLNGHPVTAFVIANFVGMVISYRLSRYWTFKHRPPQHADGGRTAYFVINTVTMLIPMACLWISRNVLGLDDAVSDNLAGVVIGALLGQAARFYLFREYVFQKPEPAAPAGLHALAGGTDDLRQPRAPQTRPRVAELSQEVPEQRQAEPHHVVVVALDAGDEGAAEAVDGERAGHVQRLAGGDVVVDLVVGQVGEVDHRGRRRGRDAVGGRVVQRVPGVQHARPPAHRPPPRPGGRRRRRACRAPRRRARAPSRSRAPGRRPAGRRGRPPPRTSARPAGARARPGGGRRPGTRRRPDTMTTGSTPAARRVARRAGDAEARGRARSQAGHGLPERVEPGRAEVERLGVELLEVERRRRGGPSPRRGTPARSARPTLYAGAWPGQPR